MANQPTCEETINKSLEGRLQELETLYKAYQEDEGDNEDLDERKEELNNYGLILDYVAPNTFENQGRGYIRYLLSWGGPSDEFRFFLDEHLNPTDIEYWRMHWMDGAKRTLLSWTKSVDWMDGCWGRGAQLLSDIYEDWKETDTIRNLIGGLWSSCRE